jgi:chromosome segregation ATPase
LKKRLDAVDAQHQALTQSHGEVSSRADSTAKSLQQLTEERDRLAKQLAEARRDAKEQAQALGANSYRAFQERDQVQAQLERESAEWRQKLAAAQAEHQRHAASLGASRDGAASKLAETAAQLEALRAELKQRDDSLRETLTRNEQEKNQLSADLARARAQREQADKAAAANQAAQAEEHRKQLAAAQAAGKTGADALQDERDKLKQERDAIAAALAAQTQKAEAAAGDHARVARERDQLSTNIQRLNEEHRKQIGELQEQMKNLEKLKAERGTLEKRIADEQEAHRRDAEAMRQAQESLASAEQRKQAEIARIETGHHNAASALAEERKRIEGLRNQLNELKREKKMELNAMAENFHSLMRERESGATQIQQEMARLREETARATTERDEAVRKADAHMAGAREAVAAEIADLKRQLDDTNQRVSQLTAERDALQKQHEEMRRLPAIRPMTVAPPTIGNPPNT